MKFRWLPVSQCESLGCRVDKWGVGTQFPAQARDLSPSRLVSDGYCGPISLGHAPNHPPPFRRGYATPPLHHILSWHPHGQLSLPTFYSKTVSILWQQVPQFIILCLSAQHSTAQYPNYKQVRVPIYGIWHSFTLQYPSRPEQTLQHQSCNNLKSCLQTRNSLYLIDITNHEK